jgi:hypothetical protein
MGSAACRAERGYAFPAVRLKKVIARLSLAPDGIGHNRKGGAVRQPFVNYCFASGQPRGQRAVVLHTLRSVR